MKSCFEELEEGMLAIVVFCNSDKKLPTNIKATLKDSDLLFVKKHPREIAIVEEINKDSLEAKFRVITEGLSGAAELIQVIQDKKCQEIITFEEVFYVTGCSGDYWKIFMDKTRNRHENAKEKEKRLRSYVNFLKKIDSKCSKAENPF